MRAVIQRARRASVEGAGRSLASIGEGLAVLVGVSREDTAEDARWLAEKTVRLRIFEDETGRMNHSLASRGGALLVVSQFTLYADCRKGNRPSFIEAAPPEQAVALYEAYVEGLRALGHAVQTGQFRTPMLVAVENDGPVTILLDSADRPGRRTGK